MPSLSVESIHVGMEAGSLSCAEPPKRAANIRSQYGIKSAWRMYRFYDLEEEESFLSQHVPRISRPLGCVMVLVSVVSLCVSLLYLADQDFWGAIPFFFQFLNSGGSGVALVLNRRIKREYIEPIVCVHSVLSIVNAAWTLMLLIGPAAVESRMQTIVSSFPAPSQSGIDSACPTMDVLAALTSSGSLLMIKQQLGSEIFNHVVMAHHFLTLLVTAMLGAIGYSFKTILTFLLIASNNLICLIVAASPYKADFPAIGTKYFMVNLGICILPALIISAFFALECRKHFKLKVLNDRTFEAGRRADSILNHTLKNIMADAAGQIDIFLEYLDSTLSTPLRRHLEASLASLCRGMRSCRHRQVYIQLAAGVYKLVRKEIMLREFISSITMGRTIQVNYLTNMENVAFVCDEVLLALILENAISNAIKHGHPVDAKVTVTVEKRKDADHRLKLTVTNIANPTYPTLGDDISSLSRQQGAKNHATSDGIGLQHISIAAQASETKVSLIQKGDLVTFEATMQGELRSLNTDLSIPVQREPAEDFPPNTHICCIDDSCIALYVVKTALERQRNVKVAMYGERGASEVSRFICDTLAYANIAILDHNLDFPGEYHAGIEVMKDLKANGFQGLLCIRSANAEEQDVLMYLAAGAHLVIGKDVPMSEAVQTIKMAYIKWRRDSVIEAIDI